MTPNSIRNLFIAKHWFLSISRRFQALSTSEPWPMFKCHSCRINCISIQQCRQTYCIFCLFRSFIIMIVLCPKTQTNANQSFVLRTYWWTVSAANMKMLCKKNCASKNVKGNYKRIPLRHWGELNCFSIRMFQIDG